jgi:lipoate-protein ligase A
VRWHLLHDAAADGASNMARDAALLDLAVEREAAFVRTYAWDPHTLSFGANEPAEKRYDRREIEERGLAVVRRPTGGRAVWHAEELTYAVAAPDGTLGSLQQSYLAIHELILGSLATLTDLHSFSLAASPPRPLAVDAGACFAAPVGGEVVSALGKVVGSAQLRERGGLLQHGSILLADQQELVTAITLGDAPPTGAAGLSRILGRPVRPGQVATAITSTFEARLGRLVPLDAELREALEARAATHRAKFLDPEWTWRR